MELPGRRMSKYEGRGETKALKQEHAQEVQGIARRPVWLEQRKVVDEVRGVKGERKSLLCRLWILLWDLLWSYINRGVRMDDRKPMCRIKKAS